ncbi:uncharacterized protein DUF4276 [Rathayibacter sp. PhB152]|uniref:DUF4276 family protein n=1 Tax=Rathayibacter sp. PhB152 TaxID=2485190 RepID=UPI000FBA1F2F|nr:DUF4276 family protein [Rathayibacter sp. PhB152]ROQ65097.1 uncharacterized protein DUF4276 [Rathayibacter sp. PhB152]
MTALIVILVEGQTEEAFVNQVLQPFIGTSVAYLQPIVVHTARTADGTTFRGGGKWAHYEAQLRRLLHQPHWSLITTMIDFYGYPSDAPQCDCTSVHAQPGCATSRERAIARTFAYDSRFVPFLALHEFETLVIAAGAASGDVLGRSDVADTFRSLVAEVSDNAELINDGPATAPSKRVLLALPDYSKVRDGVAVLEDDLGPALAFTPRFREWVERLRRVGMDSD